jgi:coatomer subunit beta
MAASTPASWTIVHQEDTSDHASDIQSLRNALEKGNEETKIQTMQKILIIMLNGDPLPGLLMHVIRFVRFHVGIVADLGDAE